MTRPPSKLFAEIHLPDAVDSRTNWVNPAAIAMVTKKERGNCVWVTILWISGHNSKLQDSDAKAFLEVWEGKNASTKL